MESASSVNDQSTVFALMNVAGTTESNLSQIVSMNGLSVASVQDDKVEPKMPEERHEGRLRRSRFNRRLIRKKEFPSAPAGWLKLQSTHTSETMSKHCHKTLCILSQSLDTYLLEQLKALCQEEGIDDSLIEFCNSKIIKAKLIFTAISPEADRDEQQGLFREAGDLSTTNQLRQTFNTNLIDIETDVNVFVDVTKQRLKDSALTAISEEVLMEKLESLDDMNKFLLLDALDIVYVYARHLQDNPPGSGKHQLTFNAFATCIGPSLCALELPASSDPMTVMLAAASIQKHNQTVLRQLVEVFPTVKQSVLMTTEL